MVWALGIGGVVIVAVVALLLVSHLQVKAWEERIRNEGETLLCWVATAPEALYEVHDVPGYATAQVVFSPKDDPELRKRLKEAARRLKKGEIVDEKVSVSKVEQFYDKYKKQRWMHPPLRLPKWLVGNVEVYTAAVNVYWRRLPENCLTLPYLYCKVLLGDSGGVQLDDYPDDEE